MRPKKKRKKIYKNETVATQILSRITGICPLTNKL